VVSRDAPVVAILRLCAGRPTMPRQGRSARGVRIEPARQMIVAEGDRQLAPDRPEIARSRMQVSRDAAQCLAAIVFRGEIVSRDQVNVRDGNSELEQRPGGRVSKMKTRLIL
jgi:hypothetical protein